MAQTASEIARSLDGEVVGDGSILITGLAPADQAKAGHLTFAENESYLDRAEKSDASAILVGNDIKSSSKVLIRVTNPRVGFARRARGCHRRRRQRSFDWSENLRYADPRRRRCQVYR